ncbi:MAG: 1-acyl-sn-glycerol-3-phosphate acyltransferase [Deltaproteobacteria bacterium]|nr:1-acyl-sn-glycerol-3-phosphate acyltransferase [Deltaproteobacteria bacterium]RLB32225.1 MAG: 1-acyl-sn-glycerol-3-phosphate acyltransferase [Deltaproteobacteria bacterium]
MIRSIAIWTLGLATTLGWTIIAAVYAAVSTSSKEIHFKCAAPWSRALLRITGVNVYTEGIENIQSTTSYIFIPNHTSFFDIFSLLAYLPVDFKFILKEELMRVPILSWGMRKAGYISISRSSPAKARRTLKGAINMIKKGTSLVIFAEGTRSYDGNLQPLKRGAFQLAMASGVPIVPVAIKGGNEIMAKGSFKLKKGAIRISVAKPISTETYGKEQMPALMGKVAESLRGMLEKP